ncbi:MAG: 3-deoxy-D-manno-octulosonic acid transferase [Rhodospirillales bacterium]|nr:3-deoxy-D-manno-octulosonic acid transferase [Rhodospirillales bacterium]
MSKLALYRAATTLGGPLIRLHLARRRARGKEDARRFGERLGKTDVTRPAGALLWVHGASVGESLSLLPLVELIRQRWPAYTVLMTTGTVTSAALMGGRLPAGAIHQYVPVDRVAYVRRFLDHWRPDVALWAESEFWPNLIIETAARDIPMILVQGRISTRSFEGWSRHPSMITRLLAGFFLCLGQSEIDTDRLRALGAHPVDCLGNLKFAKPPLPVDEQELSRLRTAIGERPCWLAASTHPGEEEIVGNVHRLLCEHLPDVLTLIVPRHPERGAEIAERLAATNLVVSRRAAGGAISPATDIHVGDTIGELGLFYRLAPVVFVGKSLAGEGGQNPLEAAQLGCAVLFGPNMSNFEIIAGKLTKSGAAEIVGDEAGLANAVRHLLTDDADRARRIAAGQAVADAEAGALDRVVEAIAPFLQPALTATRHARS